MEGVSSSCEAVAMDSEDPLFIMYTSGTTGVPTGIIHTQAGYLLYAAMTHKVSIQRLICDLERKARQHNTTERQANTPPLAQDSYFSKKKLAALGGTQTHDCQNLPKTVIFQEKLAASGGTQTHDCQLARRCSYQLSYQGSSAGWARITYTMQSNQSITNQINR